jgi:pSer/pThr/pTyr-binding forkhead associated (FHA) protein
VVLPDRSVARLHARIKKVHGRYWLTDEGSDSGTLLNHERLGLSPRALADGDEIRFGRVGVRFTLHSPDEENLEEEAVDAPQNEEGGAVSEPAAEEEEDASDGDLV